MVSNNTSLEIGTVVKSIKGRDINRFFVVVKCLNNDFVMVADGDLRKLEKPKLKNAKHLNKTNTSLNLDEYCENSKLYKFLKALNEKNNSKREVS